jgi:hypothetical protein
MATFKGSTSGGQEIAKAQQAADAPFLSASYWQKGTKVSFAVLSTHKSNNGPYVGVRLVKPDSILIEGKDVSLVRIGNLAGITLARLQALAEAKNKYFAVGDKVHLECTGITPPEKPGHSPSPNFKIEINRADEVPAEKSEVPF